MADEVRRLVILEAKTKGVKEATKEYENLSDAEKDAIIASDDLQESQEELAGAFDEVEGPLGNVIQGVKGAVTAFGNLLKAGGPVLILLTSIAAIAGAVGVAFSKSKKLQDEFRRSTAALGGALDVLTGKLTKTVEGLLGVADASEDATKNALSFGSTLLVKLLPTLAQLGFISADTAAEMIAVGVAADILEGELIELEKTVALEELAFAKLDLELERSLTLGDQLDAQAKDNRQNLSESLVLLDELDDATARRFGAQRETLNQQLRIATATNNSIEQNRIQIELIQLEKEELEALATVEGRRASVNTELHQKELEFAFENTQIREDEVEQTLEKNELIEASEVKRFDLTIEKRKENTENARLQAEIEEEIERTKNEAIFATTSDLFNGIAKLAGQNTIFGKAAAIAQATIDTFAAANSALKAPTLFPGQRFIAAAAVIAFGLANVQQILGIPLPKVQTVESSFAEGGILQGRSHRTGGIRAGGVEFEGGEAVINKRSTRMFKDILSNINFAGGGKRFQAGGVTSNLTIPQIDTQFQLQQFEELQRAVREQQVVAIVEDITSLQTQIDVREDRANLG